MNSFTASPSRLDFYTRQLPAQIPAALAKSAFFSFGWSLILGASVSTAFCAAGTAATAAILHAVVTPIFKTCFENHRITPLEKIFSSVVVLGLTQVLIKAIFDTQFKIDLTSSLVLNILGVLISGQNEYNLNKSSWYLVV